VALALEVRVGKAAAKQLEAQGWHANLFDGLIGASGGPKWLILGHLDRVIAAELLANRSRDLLAVGSSIGSWRHAMMAQSNPVAAIDRFEAAYLEQRYAEKPSVEEVTQATRDLLRVALGESGIQDIADHAIWRSHIVTARGRSLTNDVAGKGLAAGMGLAAIGNMVDRRILPALFQRVVFRQRQTQSPLSALTDFDTQYVDLSEHNVEQALLASGAIPYVFSGVLDVPGGPLGAYWDGGIIDYHFDVDRLSGDGLWLYPHFSRRTTVGWFDKFLPWRADRDHSADNIVMLCPSDAFLAALPFGKIPDRRDFAKLATEERIQYWHTCVEQSKRLADDFHKLINGADPLSGVIRL